MKLIPDLGPDLFGKEHVIKNKHDEDSSDLFQGPVVQSVVSLTSSLRGQLVKCFVTTLIFFVEKMREAFALQKLLTFFQQKILVYFR